MVQFYSEGIKAYRFRLLPGTPMNFFGSSESSEANLASPDVGLIPLPAAVAGDASGGSSSGGPSQHVLSHHHHQPQPPQEAGRLSAPCRRPGKATEDAMADHMRTSDLFQIILQVDTFLAGFLLFSLTGRKQDEAIADDEKVQVILQTFTFGVLLSAIILTALLMLCTGERYLLVWYDTLLPGGLSAAGLLLLVVTVGDAILIEMRPAVDIDDTLFWIVVVFGLLAPVLLVPIVVCVRLLCA